MMQCTREVPGKQRSLRHAILLHLNPEDLPIHMTNLRTDSTRPRLSNGVLQGRTR